MVHDDLSPTNATNLHRASHQLPLPLEFEVTYSLSDFLIAPCNNTAARAVMNWPQTTKALAIFGPRGCGKTHLASAWVTAHGGYWLQASELKTLTIAQLIQQPADMVIEDIEDCTSDVCLLHLHNLVLELGHRLLVTARSAPREWPFTLPDLRSRMQAMTAIEILAPDEALIHALLVKIAADHRLILPHDAVAYCAVRIERSFDAVQRLMTRLDHISLSRHGRVTWPMIRQALAEL